MSEAVLPPGWPAMSIEQANALITRLVDLVGNGAAGAADGRRAYEYSFVLAPIVPRRRAPDTGA